MTSGTSTRREFLRDIILTGASAGGILLANQIPGLESIVESEAEAASRKRLRVKRIKDKDLPERMVYDKKKSRKERIPVYRYKLPTYKEDSKDNTEADFLYMVFVPKGKFIMGDKDIPDNPPHIVDLDSYFIGMYEVTNEQFKKFVDETNYEIYESYNYDRDKKIAASMRGIDALKYVEWAGLELPTEAQWERAARGPYPDQRKYPWGNQKPSEKIVGKFPKSVESFKAERVGVHRLDRSPYGCYDMGGNLIEVVSSEKDKESFFLKGNYIYAPPMFKCTISHKVNLNLYAGGFTKGFRPVLNYSK